MTNASAPAVHVSLEVDGPVKMINLLPAPSPNTLQKMLYYDHIGGEILVGDVSGSSAGGSGVGAGKGGRMLVLGPRCDPLGTGGDASGSDVPWTTFSGPFANSLVDGNNGTSGYKDQSGNDPSSNNAQVIGHFSFMGGAWRSDTIQIHIDWGGRRWRRHAHRKK